jgi:hypothetical protein
VRAELLQTGSGGDAATGQPATELEVRAGQTLRLLIRPVDGPARPSGPECPVRVAVGQLLAVARLLTPGRLAIDKDNAYGLLRPGQELALDFEIKPFEEWEPAYDRIRIETLTVTFPELAEFVARLPAPFKPAPGSVCADVFFPDALPASGVSLALAASPDAAPQHRQTATDGRVCWDGLGEALFGELRLDPPAAPALSLPASRYVSRDASYRLFVVKRPDKPPAG